MLNRLVARIARARLGWPRPVNAAIDAGIGLVPEAVAVRINPAKYGFAPKEVPQPPERPQHDIRLYIAPVNFAGQGYEWARAAERLPGVGAVSMHYVGPGDFGFPGDNIVPVAVFRNSKRWQKAQFEAVVRSFTHVLIEAERPIFGSLFDSSPAREVDALRRRGLTVGMISHGSDLRLPSRHRMIDEWSPFHDTDWTDLPTLQAQSEKHSELLRELAAPVFVSTSDLIEDWPEATLLPLSVNPAAWIGGAPPLEREVPVVVHAPSNPRIKGSDLIEPPLRELHEQGLIEYRRISRVPAEEMPAIYRSADIVVEQFRIGNYSRAAVEAMMAGRLVIGHVHEQVRDHVRSVTGLDVPVVEATPANLSPVILDILHNRDHFRAVARRGIDFAQQVHDGRLSAEALRPFLLG